MWPQGRKSPALGGETGAPVEQGRRRAPRSPLPESISTEVAERARGAPLMACLGAARAVGRCSEAGVQRAMGSVGDAYNKRPVRELLRDARARTAQPASAPDPAEVKLAFFEGSGNPTTMLLRSPLIERQAIERLRHLLDRPVLPPGVRPAVSV